MANTEMTIKELFGYFENIARMHEAFGHSDTNTHYARMDFTEYMTTQRVALNSPGLLVETPDAGGADLRSDNEMQRRVVTFLVMVKPSTWNSENRANAELDAELLALEILARMKRDSRNYANRRFAHVDLDGWQGEFVKDLYAKNQCAYRISIPILNAEGRLRYNAGRWNDDDAVGVLQDTSSLSCANLNDPLLGLTSAQRLTCILPQYDFAAVNVQSALAQQQVDDLTDWLCDGGGGGSASIDLLYSDGDTDNIYRTLTDADSPFTLPAATLTKASDSSTLLSLEVGETVNAPQIEINYNNYLGVDTRLGAFTIDTWASEIGLETSVPFLPVVSHLASFSLSRIDVRGAYAENTASGSGTIQALPVRIIYFDASNQQVDLYQEVFAWYGVDEESEGTQAHQYPLFSLGRISIFESDGSTVHGYTDALLASYTLDGFTAVNTDGLPIGSGEDGDELVIDDVLISVANTSYERAYRAKTDTTILSVSLSDVLSPQDWPTIKAAMPAAVVTLEATPDLGPDWVASETWATIKGSLSSGQISDATTDLCSGSGGASGYFYPLLQDASMGERTTSNGVGSEGWQWDQGFFDNGTIGTPEKIFAHKDQSAGAFFKRELVVDNPFGNAFRFTGAGSSGGGGYYDHNTSTWKDKDGVATTEALAFPDDEIIDWCTKRVYYRTEQSAAAWSTAISNAEAATHNSHDWHMLTEGMITQLLDNSLGGSALGYEPMNFTNDLWTATTSPTDTTKGRRYFGTSGVTGNNPKTNSFAHVLWRPIEAADYP